MTTRDELITIILELANNFNVDLEYKIAVDKKEDAGLFGEGGALDSLNLVSFIIAVEQRLSDKIGVELALADEKAMSRNRSPFKSVGTLADHVLARAAQEKI